jgi:hypothetical protein
MHARVQCMDKDVASQPNKLIDSSVVYQSKWVTVRLDHYLSNGGDKLEYPLVARSDSAIILVRQDNKFILGRPQLRPGVNEHTLDFPGGRVDKGDPNAVASECVRREFKINPDVVLPPLEMLTEQPLIVDSSFSNQRVYGFLLDLPDDFSVEGTRYGADELLAKLQCLQCRAMLLEYLQISK